MLFFNLGLVENPNDSSDLAKRVDDSDGVFFVPAFTGLGVNFNS